MCRQQMSWRHDVIIYQEVAAIKAFAKDDITDIFNSAFRKLAFGQSEFWHVSADELMVAMQDSVYYYLNGMLIELAEDLVS